MPEVIRKPRKWGMPFAIIGFISGIQTFVNSIMFIVTMNIMSNNNQLNSSEYMSMVAKPILISLAISAFTAIAFSIVGLVGWRKKALATLGLVFTLIPILFYLAMFLTNGFSEGLF